jgi:RNA polymerase sigma-70 factor (ECF subfamily)
MARTAPRSAPPPASLPDAEVVARVLAGDAALFEILMRRHNQRLFRVARGILADDAEAEDVLQDAWVRAFHALGGFRGEASVVTWLTRIAAHEAMARSRRRRRLVPVEALGGGEDGGPPEREDAAAPPDRAAENRELQSALSAALDTLPDPLRAVFVLREVEGLSSQETADALEISAENARVRLHRAKAMLRRALDERIGREVRRLYLFDGDRCDRVVSAVFERLGLAGGA